MSNIADQLRDYRLNKLAHIFPPNSLADRRHQCGLCGGPASHIVGRHSGKTFVVPGDCGHHPYPIGDEPRPYRPSDKAMAVVNALIEHHGKLRKKRARSKR